MEEKKQNFESINEDNLENVNGGYAGKDRFTLEEYNEAGISHQHNIWSKDKYIYKGKPITQREAEAIATVYYYKKK